MVTRKTRDGHIEDFGRMGFVKVAGIYVLTNDLAAQGMGLTFHRIQDKDVPDFYTDIKITVNPNGSMHYYDFYVLNKAHLRLVGAALSDRAISHIYAEGRYLMSWKEGKVYSGPYDIKKFFTSVTKEQSEYYSF